MKIEINIPEDVYEEFTYLCNKTHKTEQEKIAELIKESIFSVEVENF